MGNNNMYVIVIVLTFKEKISKLQSQAEYGQEPCLSDSSLQNHLGPFQIEMLKRFPCFNPVETWCGAAACAPSLFSRISAVTCSNNVAITCTVLRGRVRIIVLLFKGNKIQAHRIYCPITNPVVSWSFVPLPNIFVYLGHIFPWCRETMSSLDRTQRQKSKPVCLVRPL